MSEPMKEPTPQTPRQEGSSFEEIFNSPSSDKTPAPKAVSDSTALLNEKIEAGRRILAIMQEQQQQNMESVRFFTEIAKQAGWPQMPGQ